MKRSIILATLLVVLCLVATACSPNVSSVGTTTVDNTTPVSSSPNVSSAADVTTSVNSTYNEDDLSVLTISWEDAERMAVDQFHRLSVVCLKRDDKLYALNCLPETYESNYDIADFGLIISRTQRDDEIGRRIALFYDGVRLGKTPVPTLREGDTLVVVWSRGWELDASTREVYPVSAAYPTLRYSYYNGSVSLFNQETKTTVELEGVGPDSLSLKDENGEEYQISDGLEFDASYIVSWQGGDIVVVADSWYYIDGDTAFTVKRIDNGLYWDEYNISNLPAGTYRLGNAIFNVD